MFHEHKKTEKLWLNLFPFFVWVVFILPNKTNSIAKFHFQLRINGIYQGLSYENYVGQNHQVKVINNYNI